MMNFMEMTQTLGLKRSLKDYQTQAQFWLQQLQLKANFRWQEYLDNLLPCHKGKKLAVIGHRERDHLHRSMKAVKATCLPLPYFSNPNSQMWDVAVAAVKTAETRRVLGQTSLALLRVGVWGYNTCRELWHHKGHLQLRLLSNSHEPEAWWGIERRYLSFLLTRLTFLWFLQG